MKFAMIPINAKMDGEGLLVRRALVKYLFKRKHKNGTIYYYGTKYICSDDYFANSSSSHKYVFKDNYYYLESVTNILVESLPIIYQKRRYHSNYAYAMQFKAKTIGDAISIFNNRDERR